MHGVEAGVHELTGVVLFGEEINRRVLAFLLVLAVGVGALFFRHGHELRIIFFVGLEQLLSLHHFQIVAFGAALWSLLYHLSFARFFGECLEQLWVHFLLPVLLELLRNLDWAIFIPVFPTV